MADARTLHAVLLELETVGLDMKRLASAVGMIGAFAKLEGIDPEDGGGIEILGEVIADRSLRFDKLVREGFDLNRTGDA